MSKPFMPFAGIPGPTEGPNTIKIHIDAELLKELLHLPDNLHIRTVGFLHQSGTMTVYLSEKKEGPIILEEDDKIANATVEDTGDYLVTKITDRKGKLWGERTVRKEKPVYVFPDELEEDFYA